MTIFHTPRTLVSIARGLLRKRQRDGAAAAAATTQDADIATKFIGFVPAHYQQYQEKQQHNGTWRTSNMAQSPNPTSTTHRIRPHVYARPRGPSLFLDVDYLGHMNNAAFLSHAEYARWEWTATTGALAAMYQHQIHFVVGAASIRYRKELRWKTSFVIHSTLEAIDARTMYIRQVFRSGSSTKSSSTTTTKDDAAHHDTTTTTTNSDGRIVAQCLFQGLALQNQKIIEPKIVLEHMGVPHDIINSLLLSQNNSTSTSTTAISATPPNLNNDTTNAPSSTSMEKDNDKKNDTQNLTSSSSSFESSNRSMQLLLQRFNKLDESFREEAKTDDEMLREKRI